MSEIKIYIFSIVLLFFFFPRCFVFFIVSFFSVLCTLCSVCMYLFTCLFFACFFLLFSFFASLPFGFSFVFLFFLLFLLFFLSFFSSLFFLFAGRFHVAQRVHSNGRDRKRMSAHRLHGKNCYGGLLRGSVVPAKFLLVLLNTFPIKYETSNALVVVWFGNGARCVSRDVTLHRLSALS